MDHMNIFRILADVSHTVSKCILIWAIHSNQSAEGVSLITQALYVLVFATRYLNLFWVSPGKDKLHIWNFVLKNFYILSSIYIIYLMMRLYARTREREKAWKFGAACLTGSAVLAPFVMMIFDPREEWSFVEVLWVFSIILESVCVLPQLILLRQTTVPTIIDSFYLLVLGSYRAFYVLSWIERATQHEKIRWDWIAPIFGVIQTAFYVDFAWVYWTRQRVKLRNGGVVDSEDISRGWLVSKLVGGSVPDEEDTIAADGSDDGIPQNPRTRAHWGTRGISVSADEGLEEAQPLHRKSQTSTGQNTVTNSSGLDGVESGVKDNIEDSLSPSTPEQYSSLNGVGNGEEWRSEADR